MECREITCRIGKKASLERQVGRWAFHGKGCLFYLYSKKIVKPISGTVFRLVVSRVVGPVQKSLALARAAQKISLQTVLLKLGDVPAHILPALDLALIVFATAAQVVTAVPLEPAAGIVMVNPAFLLPVGQGF